jgi:hypothetical protein
MVHDSLADRPEKTVWGPPSGTGILSLGPDPPVPHPNDDNYTWGVGEEADFITFLPIFNPQATSWTFPDEIWNFEQGNDTPRRAAVITMGRYSKRLLNLIHDSLAGEGLGLVSEMTGASWAFHHGLKAVHIPHPIYADGEWTPEELARIYNPGEPENINGGEDSIWNFDHLYDHIMYRLSYMFTTHTAEDLYRRWLGYRTAEGKGGKEVFDSPLFLPWVTWYVMELLNMVTDHQTRCRAKKITTVDIASHPCFSTQSRTRLRNLGRIERVPSFV